MGVDLPSYLAGLAATQEDECHYTVAELEEWSHRLQRELGFERYRRRSWPASAQGATLAHAALAQSPAATLAGAIGAEPAPALATHVPLCPGAPSRATPDGFVYEPAEELPGFWRETTELDALEADDRDRASASRPPAAAPRSRTCRSSRCRPRPRLRASR